MSVHRRRLVRAVLDSQNANLVILELHGVMLRIDHDRILGDTRCLLTHGLPLFSTHNCATLTRCLSYETGPGRQLELGWAWLYMIRIVLATVSNEKRSTKKSAVAICGTRVATNAWPKSVDLAHS